MTPAQFQQLLITHAPDVPGITAAARRDDENPYGLTVTALRPVGPDHAYRPARLACSHRPRTGGNADWRVIGLAPGHIPAATPSTARPAHQATVPATSSHATGFPKLSIQPTPKRAPTTMAGSSRLT
jgi:hypothetical protein